MVLFKNGNKVGSLAAVLKMSHRALYSLILSREGREFGGCLGKFLIQFGAFLNK